ncbi:uncharacterized protein LOC143150345 [Ptiloglossa arizonensis]|uniref:uncharacterized protein LOC143150345 n=1 Tax=Ptiloglossa arizonensis TaxID=3350558 RepID=UPI003FA16CCD
MEHGESGEVEVEETCRPVLCGQLIVETKSRFLCEARYRAEKNNAITRTMNEKKKKKGRRNELNRNRHKDDRKKKQRIHSERPKQRSGNLQEWRPRASETFPPTMVGVCARRRT